MERAFVLIKGWLVTGVLASVCNYIYTLRLNKPEKVVTPLEAAPGLLIMLAIIILSQLTHKLMQKAAPKVKAPVVSCTLPCTAFCSPCPVCCPVPVMSISPSARSVCFPCAPRYLPMPASAEAKT